MAPKAKAKVKPPVKTPKKAPPAKKAKTAKANEDDPTEEKAGADQAGPSQPPTNKPEKLYAKITRHMHTLSAFVSLPWLQPHEKRTRLIQRDGVRNILRNIEVVGKF
jgi:hypothetical protein